MLELGQHRGKAAWGWGSMGMERGGSMGGGSAWGWEGSMGWDSMGEVAWGLGRDGVVVCWGSMRGGGNVHL